jgi:hypothetical protein
LCCPSAVKKPTTNFSVSHLHGFVFKAKLCYDFPNHHASVFCVEHINFLFVAFHDDGSWSMAARQMKSVPVTISEAVYPISTHY